MRILIIACFGFIAGCQGAPVNELSYSELRALAAEIEARCEAQGIKRNSTAWRPCLKQETSREDAKRRNAKRRRESGFTCFNSFGTVICN